MFTLSVGVGETVRAGDCTITVREKSGQRVNLVFDVPDGMPINIVHGHVPGHAAKAVSYGITGKMRRELKLPA